MFGGPQGKYEWEQRKSALFSGTGSRVFLEYATSTTYSKESGLGKVHAWLLRQGFVPATMYKRAVLSVAVYTCVSVRVLKDRGIYVHPDTTACYHVRSYALRPVVQLPLHFLGGVRVDRFIPMSILLPYMQSVFSRFR